MSLFRNCCAGCLTIAVLLAGCGPSQPVKSPVAAQPQATAPALPPPGPAPLPQTAAQQTMREQNVQQLIDQVEKAYANGETAYRKGHLTDAKAEFDRAVDMLLTTGLDIKSEPRLQEEFDHIVDQVNGLEMEALKQGNGFAPKVEPTPADVAGDVTFEAVDPKVVAKAQTQLATTKSDLPLMVNDYVAAFINFFANSQKGHNTLLHSFQRYGRYKSMIERVMAEEGVPHDLIYLAVAESSFQPRAVNARSRAGGMWQFMPYGDYGLTRNGYVDERFDPEKSTRAYARYMKFLYGQLGDWYLSMAAYDWGAGNVQRAVQKTGYADFWELYRRHNLPAETQNYVPEILAAIIIANHPTQYGFDDITLDPPILTDTVTINYAVDLRLVSDLVNASVDELMALNPSLLRMATPPDTAFDLHLPAGAAALFEQRIGSIPESKRTAWRYHRLTPEDTLASVARTYRVTAAELAAANQVREDQGLAGLQALVVPVAPIAAASVHTLLYTTRRGDTLVSIADRFGVSLDQLRRWNKISAGIKVEPGRRLHVAEPSSARPSSGQRSSERKRHSSAASRNGATRGGAAGGNKASGEAAKSSSSRTAAKPSSGKARHKLYAEEQK
ncbi:MAG TPA: transglycosylase SLT domain-containing protein [Terracidiphilus sp.]